jgi:anthranilate synthase component 1
MIYPDREEFLKKSKSANLIPVYTEIMADLETPVSAFMKLSESPYAYLLESVEGGSQVGRYSFLGFAPERVIRVAGDRVTVTEDGQIREDSRTTKPLDRIVEMVSGYSLPETATPLPFCGGAVGYLSYDTARQFEKIPDTNEDPLKAPDACFMFTDRYLIFDRVTHRLRVVANARIDGSPEEAFDTAVGRIEETVQRLGSPVPVKNIPYFPPRDEGMVSPSISQEEFCRGVERCLEYIRRGDILQAVLSLRFEVPINQNPFNVYRALRVLNPSPYMFYLKMGDLHLVGSSPETMVKLDGAKVALNPIAGTRPRGRSPAEDQSMEKDLLEDGKEAAEHLMLVDLGRNDLGRICLPGTVSVPSFRRVERFSHVMHLVSTVEGEMKSSFNFLDVVRATFPAGTVSGAPKIRAMEIIDEVENLRRGPYAGLVGYFDYRGNMDSCITIRTIFIKNSRAYIQTGAGIVADSVPEKEYMECQHKAEALFRAIRMAGGGIS